MSALAPTLQAFFTDRLAGQRRASPNTIAAYRDTLRLLIGFAAQRLHHQPSELDIGDLDAEMVAAFLAHLETERGNSIKTRNARLAAIRARSGSSSGPIAAFALGGFTDRLPSSALVLVCRQPVVELAIDQRAERLRGLRGGDQVTAGQVGQLR
jgi:hypothetical protein